MGLKTNCKAVKEAIRGYLLDQVSEMMEERNIVSEHPLREYWNIINEEKFYQKYRCNFDMFKDWLQGLGGFGADIYYTGSSRGFEGKVQDLLQDWLQQSDDEVKKYKYYQSEELAVRLCWREFNYMLNKEKGVA